MKNLNEDLKSGYSIKKDIVLIGSLLCFAIFCFFINYWFVKKISAYDNRYISYTNELTVLSQSISKNANEAVDGSLQAFRLLKKNQEEFTDILVKLRNGEIDESNVVLMPPSTNEISDSNLQELEQYWSEVSRDINMILLGEGGLLKLYTSLSLVNKLRDEIEQNIEELFRFFQDEKQDSLSVMAIQQISNFYKVLYNMTELSRGGRNARSVATALIKSLEAFYNDINFLSDKLRKELNQKDVSELKKIEYRKYVNFVNSLKSKFSVAEKDIRIVSKMDVTLSNLEFASNRIYSNSQGLLKKSIDLKEAYFNISEARIIGDVSTNGLIILSLLLLILLGYRTHVNSRNSYIEVQKEKSKNEKAIQLLVHELIDLANGNLTVNATVTDGILGAIAESINYAINALRRLIFIVNQTTEKVSVATKETKDTTKKLAEASSHQASEIVAVTASVNAMATSIEQVSKNAHKSEEVAEYSLDTASNGKQIVQNTIEGMEKIRQQIQETSKKIKRLGESSQEIGEMVLLIDDIAEQTNILSLNAAIQAAMAGEAGKGFAVVADEVQRLAERSSDATKQISAIVKTIQADTNQAVTSMEDTTAQVVRGARLSEDAGIALNKIENVSNQLANLVKDIAEEATQQAKTSSIISKTMDIIQSIATDTASGTATTAGSTGMLAELVTDLRNSVAGFLLPKDMRVE